MATARLRLTRRFGGILTKHDWDLHIDGRVVGSIAYRRTVDFRVAPGHHTLRLGSKRQVSPERSFDIAKGEVVSFWCRSVSVLAGDGGRVLQEGTLDQPQAGVTRTGVTSSRDYVWLHEDARGLSQSSESVGRIVLVVDLLDDEDVPPDVDDALLVVQVQLVPEGEDTRGLLHDAVQELLATLLPELSR